MAIDKYESRRIRSEIRRVLLDYWDPIGVRGEPKAQDEYDSYLGGICELLVSGASDEEIANHLRGVIEERMELRPQGDATERTVRQLRTIPIPNH
jgi:hypothetical protein